MLNIKRLLLGNFLTFNDVSNIRLAPLTILTGPNNSGKSSVARSLSLMQNTDWQTLPFRLRLDFRDSPGGFEAIKNNKSDGKQIKLGYDLYNILLGETVKVEFSFSKGGHFDAPLKSMKVSNSAGKIFEFEFAERRIVSKINAAYLYKKLTEVALSKEKYIEFEKSFRRIHSSSGSYNETKNKESNVRIFHADNEVRRKNLEDYLKDQNVKTIEYERLSYFFGKNRELNDCAGKKFIERTRKIIDDFDRNKILFNNDLLGKIVAIPAGKLSEEVIYSIIKTEFPDLYDCMVLLNEKDYVNRIVSLLASKSYDEWERDYLDCDITTTRQVKGNEAEDELSLAIEHNLQARFELIKFFRAVTELSMIREGFNQTYNSYINIRSLTGFAGLVIDKILYDLRYDIDNSLALKPQEYYYGTGHDFNDPVHEIIKKYSQIRKRDTFLKKWLSEFRIGEDFVIDVPVKGMGYSPRLIRNNASIPLSEESAGTKKLVSMLLEIATSREYCEIRDFNNDKRFNPRTLVVEQPETGFHPSWQSKLGDLFADAKNQLGLNFIIETHSDYIINKLQYLVASGKLHSDDVIIYYFDNESGVPRYTEIELEVNGNLSREIPGAFIDEEDRRSIGLFKLRKIGRN